MSYLMSHELQRLGEAMSTFKKALKVEHHWRDQGVESERWRPHYLEGAGHQVLCLADLALWGGPFPIVALRHC